MTDRPKLAAIAVSMAVLWIVVYWATPAPESAAGEGVTVSFGETPAGLVDQQAAYEPPVAAEPPAEEDRPARASLDEAMARVIPPNFEKYVVQYGDNAHTISRAVYGTSAHWQSILKANSLADPSKFREGQTIRYPVDPGNVQGIPVDAEGEPIAKNPVATPEKSADAEYIVQRGDTLSGIAKVIYGRATMWRLIRDANRGKVNSEGTNIRPGMTLVIPPPPASN